MGFKRFRNAIIVPKMGKKTAITMPVITLFKNFSSCFYHFFTIFSR